MCSDQQRLRRVVDRRLVPDSDLSALRNAAAFAGLLALLYGLITSTTRSPR